MQEIKTLAKRIEKKRKFIEAYLWRSNQIKDPHEKDGGSHMLIKKERQAILDLENNIINIKRRINMANAATHVTICGETRTIADWLIWRRELATKRKRFLESVQLTVQSARSRATQRGIQVSDDPYKAGVNDVIVNVDEKLLAEEIERIEEILSSLDGQLSLKNATVQIGN